MVLVMALNGRSGTPAEQTRAGDSTRVGFRYTLSLPRQRRLFQNISLGKFTYLLQQDSGISCSHILVASGHHAAKSNQRLLR